MRGQSAAAHTFDLEKTKLDDAARERRLRQIARKQGFSIKKARFERPEDPTFGGYMILNSNNLIEHGDRPNGFSLSLDDVEEFLLSPS